jgi:hypothetical protein
MKASRRAATFAPVLALAFVAVAPAQAGSVDTSACKRDLTAASAGVSETMTRLRGVTKARREEKCAAYRAHFLVVVRARAVFANCKTGSDRDTEVGRLDGTIEDINGVIAESCAVQ